MSKRMTVGGPITKGKLTTEQADAVKRMREAADSIENGERISVIFSVDDGAHTAQFMTGGKNDVRLMIMDLFTRVVALEVMDDIKQSSH